MRTLVLIVFLLPTFLFAQSNEAKMAFNEGINFLRQNQQENAIEAFQKAVSFDDSFEAAHHTLADIYDRDGQGVKAIYHYKKVVQLAPQDYKALFNLAMLFEQEDQASDAVDALVKAVAINKDYGKAYHKLGNLYSTLEQYQFAVDNYLFAEAKGYKVRNFEFKVANNLYKLGNYKEAQEYLNGAIENNPSGKVYYLAGICHHKLEEESKALEMYQKTTELLGNYLNVYVNLGIIYYNRGFYDIASISFKKSVKYDINDGDLFSFLGQSEFHTEDIDQSIKNLQNAIRLKPTDTNAHYFLAGALKMKGEEKAALSHLARAKIIQAELKKESMAKNK